MASEKQILANQENAKKSTGPRTRAGKDIARCNSLTNGLRSMGFVLPEHIANEISEHTEWIHSALKADNPLEIALEETLAHEMVMVAETNRCLVARRLAIALRAQDFWDDDQLAKWAEVAETLPTKPAAIARRMRNDMHGCLILLERWGQLEEILMRSGNWKESQQGMALDLMGISHALRDNGTILDVPAGMTAHVHLQGIVRDQVKELEARCERLADEADAKREHACKGYDPEDAQTKTLEGYSTRHFGKMIRSYEQFGRVDRKARLGIPSAIPKRKPNETYYEFQERMSYSREKHLEQQAQERARNAGERERKLEAERLAALENPPQYHEGLPMEEFIRRVNEWKVRREGKLPEPPVESMEPPIDVNATLAGAMPQPPEPEEGTRIEFFYPASDDDSDTATEENQDDRHDE